MVMINDDRFGGNSQRRQSGQCISIQQDALTAELYVSVRDAVVSTITTAKTRTYGAGWWAVFRGFWSSGTEIVVWSAMDVSHSSSKISWYYRNTKDESVRRCCVLITRIREHCCNHAYIKPDGNTGKERSAEEHGFLPAGRVMAAD